jgi:hypothetical protein
MLTDEAGVVIDRWVIVMEPGMEPEVKSPMGHGQDAALKLVRELMECRSADTILIMVRLTWNHDLWTDEARGYLEVQETLAAAAA